YRIRRRFELGQQVEPSPGEERLGVPLCSLSLSSANRDHVLFLNDLARGTFAGGGDSHVALERNGTLGMDGDGRLLDSSHRLGRLGGSLRRHDGTARP